MSSVEEKPAPQTSSPRIAVIWGWAGVLPFLALAAAKFGLNSEFSDFAMQALIAYGAIILAFMGGVHWGLVMNGSGQSDQNAGIYTAGILPAVVATAATFVPHSFGAMLLAAGFLGLLVFDLWLVRRAYGPEWYSALRVRLTIPVVACLALVSLPR